MDGVMLAAPDVETDPAKRDRPKHKVLVQNPNFVADLTEDEQGVLQIAVVQSPEFLEMFRSVLKPGFAVADRVFLRRISANYAFSFDVDTLPAPFAAPALIVTGRQDALCGYREAWGVLENYPRGTFAVLDRAGHPVSFEQQTLFRALTNEWLDRVEEYSIPTTTH